MRIEATRAVRIGSEQDDRRLIEGVVSNLTIFRDSSPHHIDTVVAQCWTLLIQRGQLAMGRGTRLPGLFAVAYGTVKLALCDSGKGERVLRIVSGGETFGEAVALLGRASPYEARVLAQSRLVVIPSAAIFNLMDRDPRFARAMVMTVAHRKVELLAEVESVTMRCGAQRLAHYLSLLAKRTSHNRPCTVQLPATKTLIASRLDMKKETLSRLLRSLANQGLIAIERRDITILDHERLAEIARHNSVRSGSSSGLGASDKTDSQADPAR